MITGQQVREARGRNRWKQKQLADALGVTVRTLGAWEREEVRVPVTAEALIRDMLTVVDAAQNDEGAITLASATDAQLMTALANRLANRKGSPSGAPGPGFDAVEQAALNDLAANIDPE